jgi:hypothetical protein
MDDEPDTFLFDRDPAKLLPYTKRLLPEDPEIETLGRHFMRDSISEANDVFPQFPIPASDDL